MKQFEIYQTEERGIPDYLDGTDSESLKETVFFSTLGEAKDYAREKYGDCIVRWIRKDGQMGYADYEVRK
ncbi:MAG: hypothetical protein HUK18_00160 [Bacteroidales bacterium]|nr:hypothetical protein [Bacteroidales bacterium]